MKSIHIFFYIQGEKGKPSQEYINPLSSDKIQRLRDALAKVWIEKYNFYNDKNKVF